MPNLGTTEILLILAVVILLFGAKKLPELARGSGKALRIFKSEVKAMHNDDDEPKPASLGTVEATEQDKKHEQD